MTAHPHVKGNKPQSYKKIIGSLVSRITDEDKSVMMLIVGEMGSGKSLAGVDIADYVDPTFRHNPRIVYTVEEFTETLETMKDGQALIFDEVGVGVPAREWQQIQNRVMSILAQILRFKKVFIIFTTPNIRFVDINLRESMNAFIKPKRIIKDKNVNVCRYKHIYTNDNGEVRRTNFIWFDKKNGAGGELIENITIPRPDPELERYYEKISKDFKNKKIAELKDVLNGNSADKTDIKVMSRKADAFLKLLNFVKPNYKWAQIVEVTGVSESQLMRWREAAAEA